MHLILFAGPVMVKPIHRSIDWNGLDVKIVPIQVSGSSNAAAMADSFKDQSGRMLPSILAKYAPGIKPESITLASYSAGWGLWNKVVDNDDDRAIVDALILNDSVFLGGDPRTGKCQGVHGGFVKFGVEAVGGYKLMAITSAHTTSGSHLTGRQSVICDLDAILKEAGHELRDIPEPSRTLKASGGWHKAGDLYWGDFTKPGSLPGSGNDVSHEGHHDLSAPVWQALLVPWLKRGDRNTIPWWLIPAIGLFSAYVISRKNK